MAVSTTENHPRTKGEALIDLDYAIEISVLNQRFHERVHKGIALLSLLAGSSAFVSIFRPLPWVVAVSGLTIGMLAIAEQVYDFRGRAVDHAQLSKRLTSLRARSAGLTLEKLDAAVAKLAADSTPVIQGLRKPARNNNLRRHGFPNHCRPLTRWERLLNALV